MALKVTTTIRIDVEVIERLKNAVYWTPEFTMSGFIESAVEEKMNRLEQDNSISFKDRPNSLKRGRRVL